MGWYGRLLEGNRLRAHHSDEIESLFRFHAAARRRQGRLIFVVFALLALIPIAIAAERAFGDDVPGYRCASPVEASCRERYLSEQRREAPIALGFAALPLGLAVLGVSISRRNSPTRHRVARWLRECPEDLVELYPVMTEVRLNSSRIGRSVAIGARHRSGAEGRFFVPLADLPAVVAVLRRIAPRAMHPEARERPSEKTFVE